MRKILFVLSFAGLVAGCLCAYLFGLTQPPLPPAFAPPTNPYPSGIYAEGIIERDQPSGENINVYPEVPGVVKTIFVAEGQQVRKGAPLLLMDDTVQRATVEQQQAQVDAALSLLEELQAQPRKENVDVSKSQVDAMQASLKTTEDALAKQQIAWQLNPKSISKDALDSASNATATARANLDMAQKQYDLVKAGAWSYDITNQRKQVDALEKGRQESSTLLAKYMVLAPRDAVVMTISAAVGSFISTQGTYDSYTQAAAPVMVLGSPHASLSVRCYVDEILVPRLPPTAKIKAQMSIRGSSVKIPMEFVRVQPFVSPKIELSDQRQERVDVRVLPVIFRVNRPADVTLYPGQLVDVYIGE